MGAVPTAVKGFGSYSTSVRQFGMQQQQQWATLLSRAFWTVNLSALLLINWYAAATAVGPLLSRALWAVDV
jgi:hypothetical protein